MMCYYLNVHFQDQRVNGKVAQQAVGFSNFIYRYTAFLKVAKIVFLKYICSFNLSTVCDM